MKPTLQPAVFLDRDGTLNVEKDYLYRVEDFEFIPGAVNALRRLKAAGFLLFIVTNQSGVARGYFTLEDVERLHHHVQQELVRQGTAIDAFYVCPHHPERGLDPWRRTCDCRKGNPGLLLQAAGDYGVDLSRSFMVGDKVADIEAGRRAGCTPLLVLTGYGSASSVELGDDPVVRCVDLAAAVEWILRMAG
ncbi:D-glycero-beta-D-manno-heptose 1,7-bisphosphate 7-phosphatase [Desulfuromonas carbonis]|uniref:D-glycero-beta-D-manno-heptose 1,7-bisphosphate 7-phosphatase n=1 Tax=Desulfuromonas sp. DDH964 TaxID=1823759 RepID=UPI00078D2194|nr:D-glycero-beta-D-manno-heptose 1,7-bisphosphate 7-phosphatase [Desulfuromonas sp. DDH964]AMV72652.1 D-glycero-D-mannoheptose-1,7-bisphosphate phosphatase [Desulfuromonas sp. DDH964]